MIASAPKHHPLRRALDALLASLVTLALSLSSSAGFAQNERPVELQSGFNSYSPHANPTPELPSVDVVESEEDSEDTAHNARRGLAPDSFQIRSARSTIRITDSQQPDVLLSRQTARSFHARGPPTLA